MRKSLLVWAPAALMVTATLPLRGQASESWPQKFDLVHGGHASFAFVASQPGKIAVTIQAQSVPLTVSLSGPLAQAVEKSGQGTVTLEYVATGSDVARSSVWFVQIREQGAAVALARPPMVGAPSSATPTANILKPVASGTIAVVHPANDPAKLKTVLAARPLVALQGSPSASLGQQIADQQRAQYARAMTAAHATQLQQLAQLKPTQPPPPVPSVYPDTGRPGDWIWVDGPGLGGVQGTGFNAGWVWNMNVQLHFVLSGKDYAPKTVISEAGYDPPPPSAQVPDLSGVHDTVGQVYFVMGTQRSARVPFKFKAIPDFATLAPLCNDADAVMTQIDFPCPASTAWITHDASSDFSGHWGEDKFYVPTSLKNGWTVDSVAIVCPPIPGQTSSACTNAFVIASRVGTASPYVDVYWEISALSAVRYNVFVMIKGPRGLPYK